MKKKDRGLFNALNEPLNAQFITRRGPITLNLATTGTSDAATKAFVQVSTRHGNCNVNVVSLFGRYADTVQVVSGFLQTASVVVIVMIMRMDQGANLDWISIFLSSFPWSHKNVSI